MKELEERLDRMAPWNMLTKQAEMVDSTKKILGGIPMKMKAI